ncbi:Cysteine dioxygenase CDG1 [Spathaspora sp. JA1]|nr:Cysteine dioxygenase CDG1 [Spathaspora sp. JA1]
MLLKPNSLFEPTSSRCTTPPISCPTTAAAAVSQLLPGLDHGLEINGTTIDCIPESSEFYKLIQDLKRLLGKDKGLSSEEIDIDKVKQLMEDYKSEELDWGKFALHDSSRNYSRNGIININGNANLLILVWSPEKSSAIHDHANAHCCMKILAGELVESLYDIPRVEGSSKMEVKKMTTLVRDEVGYISDNIGLHRITNPLKDRVSVSLHLYTPPYAAMYGCSMYESNGTKHHVDMSKYYSWQGKLVNPGDSSTC